MRFGGGFLLTFNIIGTFYALLRANVGLIRYFLFFFRYVIVRSVRRILRGA